MSWVSAVASIAGTAYKMIKGNDKVNAPATPKYSEDPNFSSSQTFLKDYFEKMLQGNIPDYYKSIGMTSDQAAGEGLMNDYVNQSTTDIVNRDLEAGALTGRGRTGLSSDALNQAGNLSGALRYADYARAMQGKMDLLNTGITGESDVRDAAAWNMNNENAFNKWKYGADLSFEQSRAGQANARTEQIGNGIQSIGNSIGSLAGGSGGGIMSYLNQFNGGQSSANATSATPSTINDVNYGNIAYKSGGTQGSQTQLAELLKQIYGIR